MKTIELTKGLFAKVDDADYEMLMQYKWYAHITTSNKYYARTSFILNGKRVWKRMHQIVTGKDHYDHIDRDGLNNQKSNLRFATRSQQSMNSIMKSKTGYKGIYKKGNSYSVVVSGKYIKSYTSLEQAIYTYNASALLEQGDFAFKNILGQSSDTLYHTTLKRKLKNVYKKLGGIAEFREKRLKTAV